MVGKLTGEVVTKEELYEAAWATDCGLSMSKYAEAYQINRSSADCLQRKFLTALARVLFPEIQAFFESEEGQREFAEWKAQQGMPLSLSPEHWRKTGLKCSSQTTT